MLQKDRKKTKIELSLGTRVIFLKNNDFLDGRFLIKNVRL